MKKVMNLATRFFQIAALLIGLHLHVNIVSAETVKTDLLSRLAVHGELTQGSAIIGKLPFGASLKLNEKPIKSTPSGEFFIGFSRDDELNQKLTCVFADGTSESRVFKLSKRDYDIQKVNGVPQKTVSPSEEHLKRIQEENALVAKARDQVSDLTYFVEKFIPPMQSEITGVYGSQRFYNGEPKRPHYGVDYAGPIGAPVYAPASGRVILVHPDMFYSGGTLIIDHGYGLSSSFLHLSEVLVKVGDEIKQGDLIAKVGKGGRATGPHLDWRMNWLDVRIDPLKVIAIHEGKE